MHISQLFNKHVTTKKLPFFNHSFFSIKTLEENHDATCKELIENKTQYRKTERQWMSEKEFLMRKVQFLQTYGSVVPPSIDGGGYFTENRSNVRKGGELKGEIFAKSFDECNFLTSMSQFAPENEFKSLIRIFPRVQLFCDNTYILCIEF